jgi:hypothetical protein
LSEVFFIIGSGFLEGNFSVVEDVELDSFISDFSGKGVDFSG